MKKILLLGENNFVVSGIIKKLSETRKVVQCEFNHQDFDRCIGKHVPELIIIYLEKVERRNLLTFREIYEHETTPIPFIIIGSENECRFFHTILNLEPTEELLTPVVLSVLLDKVDKHLGAEEIIPVELQEQEIQPRKRVLVVDDDSRILRLIRFYLEGDYDVSCMTNGKLALIFLRKIVPDIILLDYMMPEQSGVEVLEKIRENPMAKDIPVIFLTGLTDKEKVMECISMKPQGYLMKPTSKKMIIDAIENVFRGAQ